MFLKKSFAIVESIKLICYYKKWSKEIRSNNYHLFIFSKNFLRQRKLKSHVITTHPYAKDSLKQIFSLSNIIAIAILDLSRLLIIQLLLLMFFASFLVLSLHRALLLIYHSFSLLYIKVIAIWLPLLFAIA